MYMDVNTIVYVVGTCRYIECMCLAVKRREEQSHPH